jgi:hypothetical protein
MLVAELWHCVLLYLNDDALATVRMVCAAGALWRDKRGDANFWQALERMLPNHTHYVAFRSVHKHLGVRRRVLAWAAYCDARCTRCGADLFGLCTGTFAVQAKLCYGCKASHLMSEYELARYAPAGLLLALRSRLRYCWIPYPSGQRVRHYLRHEALYWFHRFNYASLEAWAARRL